MQRQPAAPASTPVIAREPGHSELARPLGRFEPVALAEIDSVALQDRTDTKYVVSAAELQPILAALVEHAWILEIDHARLHDYQTLYFDTADFALYRFHHAGGRNRFKVRSRHYGGSGLSYLEVKLKTNTDRTVKHRIATGGFVKRLGVADSAFLATHLPPGLLGLEARLWNTFRRITLVGKDRRERMTVDLELCFSGAGRSLALPGVAIVEIKQADYSRASEFVRVMRSQGLRSTAFSKYCIGASLLYPELKHNNFKQQHRLLDRLIQGDARDAR